jgi:hypothetical protein
MIRKLTIYHLLGMGDSVTIELYNNIKELSKKSTNYSSLWAILFRNYSISYLQIERIVKICQ